MDGSDELTPPFVTIVGVDYVVVVAGAGSVPETCTLTVTFGDAQ